MARQLSLCVIFFSVFGIRADPSRRLQTELDEAIKAGEDIFSMEAGEYRFDSVDFLVDNARDLVIAPKDNSTAVTLLFTCNWGLVVRSSINVSVHNVTVDYDPPCFSQGVVTSEEGGKVNYTVDDGFITPDSDPRFQEALVVKVINWDPVTGLLRKVNRILPKTDDPIRHIEGRTYEIAANGAKLGEVLTVGPRMGHTVMLSDCTECGVYNVTVHGTSDMALQEYGGGGANVWRGNRVVRNSARNPVGFVGSTADIFQSSGVERGPVFELNELFSAGDDCVNIHNYFSVVVKRDPNNTKRVLLLDGVGEAALTGVGFEWHQELNTFSRVRAGDEARVYDEQDWSLRLVTNIVSAEESTLLSDLQLANQTLLDMGFRGDYVRRAWVGQVRCYWVTFQDRIPDAYLSHAFVNIDRLSGAGAIVRNNTFYDCGCTRVKSIGGVVSNNRFNHTGAIVVETWPSWLEGSAGLRDILVSDNSFTNLKGKQHVTIGKGTSNITVLNNNFVATEVLAV